MPLILKKIRECDGVCCKEAPQFPDETSTEHKCVYQEGITCVLQRDRKLPAEHICPANPKLSGNVAFYRNCLQWPQNTIPGEDLGGCCWKWVDE